jgi:hypothetical protein
MSSSLISRTDDPVENESMEINSFTSQLELESNPSHIQVILEPTPILYVGDIFMVSCKLTIGSGAPISQELVFANITVDDTYASSSTKSEKAKKLVNLFATGSMLYLF